MIGLVLSLFLLGEVTVHERVPVGTVLDYGHLDGDEADVDQLVGRQVKRTVFPGRAISLADTKAADLVERNGIVRVIARKGPLVIETKGRALKAGAEGDEIMIMNLESRRTVSARVVGPSTVEVAL